MFDLIWPSLFFGTVVATDHETHAWRSIKDVYMCKEHYHPIPTPPHPTPNNHPIMLTGEQLYYIII